MQSDQAKFAIGIPSDFEEKRQMDFYRDKQDPVTVTLPLVTKKPSDAEKAFGKLVSCMYNSTNYQTTNKGSRESQKGNQRTSSTDFVKSFKPIK